MSNDFKISRSWSKMSRTRSKTTVEAFPKAAQRISAETADYSKQAFKNWD